MGCLGSRHRSGSPGPQLRVRPSAQALAPFRRVAVAGLISGVIACDEMDTAVLRRRLLETAPRVGLDRVGIASADSFDEVTATMTARIEDGSSARLGFTYKDPARSTSITETFPWARRLVVGIRSYLPEAGTARPAAGHARIARFAVDDPYVPLRGALDELALILGGAGFRAEVLVDDDRLVDRAAAVRAGVAWWGKSTMAITPGLGPWFVIGSIVTDATLALDVPMTRGCGTCEACLPACPTGALVAPGVLDARRCLAALAQSSGVIPRRWRPLMGDRLYGCDDCLDACPPGARLGAGADADRGSVPTAWVLTAADHTLLDRFGHFYLPGRSPRTLRRNALIVMGNEGSESDRDLIELHVGHPDWLLRAHAVWAMARLGGRRTLAILHHRRGVEREEAVRAEIEAEVGVTTGSGQEPRGR